MQLQVVCNVLVAAVIFVSADLVPLEAVVAVVGVAVIQGLGRRSSDQQDALAAAVVVDEKLNTALA